MPDFAFYCKDKAMYGWLDAGLDAPRFNLGEMQPGAAGLRTVHDLTGRTGRHLGRFVQEWRFPATGPECSFLFELDSDLPELPRIGVVCALAAGFEQVRWYGRGPHECYSDRKAGAPVGLYESTVDGLQVPYILPQENGNRTDVRWVEILAPGPRDSARGLRIGGASTFDFGASHFETEQLWKARHTCDPVGRPEVYLTVDVAQRGLGTAACGPDTLERYRLRPGSYRLELSFSVLAPSRRFPPTAAGRRAP